MANSNKNDEAKRNNVDFLYLIKLKPVKKLAVVLST